MALLYCFFQKNGGRVIHSIIFDIVHRWEIHSGCKILASECRKTSKVQLHDFHENGAKIHPILDMKNWGYCVDSLEK